MIKHKLVYMLIERINPFLGILCGFTLFLWGVWVLTPSNNALELGSQYELLTAIAIPAFWGVVAVAIGVAQMIAAWTIRVDFIRYATAAAALFWSWLATSYAISDWHHLAFVLALHFAILNIWGYANVTVRKNNGMSDNRENQIR